MGALLGLVCMMVSKILSMVFLSMGPTLIVTLYFYQRYRTSTFKSQILYTFLEAICWMAPLMIAISLLDPVNRMILGKEVEHTCTWSDNKGGEAFIKSLSLSAHCKKTGGVLVGNMGSESCADEKNHAVPFEGWGNNYPVHYMLDLNEAEGVHSCSGLKDVLQDSLHGKVATVSFSHGSRTATGGDSKQLGSVYSQLFSHYNRWHHAVVKATFKIQSSTIQWAFVNAYFRAAFLEELLKYLAVRRILYKDRVADAGGLLMYGLASAAGFATTENIEYTIMHGIGVAFGRMVMAIPMHFLTGLIIGIHLGSRKFMGKHRAWYVAMAMPVLIHGTYDLFLMLPKYVPISQPIRIVLSVLTILAGMAYCRHIWLDLDNVCIVDVEEMAAQDRLSRPKCCCCERGNIAQFRVHEDPLFVKPRSLKLDDEGESEEEEVMAPMLRDNADPEELEQPHLVTHLTNELFNPPHPTHQTRKAICPGCGNPVRVQTMYPSSCPFCSYKFADPCPWSEPPLLPPMIGE